MPLRPTLWYASLGVCHRLLAAWGILEHGFRARRGTDRSGSRGALFWIAAVAIGAVLGGPEIRGASPLAKGARRDTRPYAIVVEKDTAADPDWQGVVEALRKKHAAQVFHAESGGLKDLREGLAALRPRYVCFVARPAELARQGKARGQAPDGRVVEFPLHGLYYRDAAALVGSLDKDGYDHAVWSVLTGATPQDALRVVQARPLRVRRGLSHIGAGWLEWLESGVSFNESSQGKKWTKQPGKPPQEVRGPDDTTEEFAAELNSGKVDMVSTSGHATEHDWQLGYSYPDGQIVTTSWIAKLPAAAQDNYKQLREKAGATPTDSAGGLLAVDRANRVYEIRADNPKIYFSPGNCRIARVDGPECLALAWIRHGAMQFFGHVGLQTRSCYAWGVAEYFLALGGRFTFAEAVWLNQQAMRWELGQMGDQDKKDKYICCRNQTPAPAGPEFFWETVVLYGDPAWEARVEPQGYPLYDQELRTKDLGSGRKELVFTVRMRRGSHPSRPAAFLLNLGPVLQVEVQEGPANLLVTDNFALVPFWKPGEPAPPVGKEYKAVAVVRTTAAGQ